MTDWISSFTSGTLRNDFTGWVGNRFIVGPKDIRVTELGRWIIAGNTQAHEVKLVDGLTGLDCINGKVNVAGYSTAGVFKYIPLIKPIVLKAGQPYYIVSFEVNALDQWYNNDTTVLTSREAVPSGIVYTAGTDPPYFFSSVPTTLEAFGPLSFKTQFLTKTKVGADYTYPLHTPIPDEAQEAILASSSRITRRLEIYEEDGITEWLPDIEKQTISGNISVDQTRDERRSFELELNNIDNNISHGVNDLWYDKIIKPFRGVSWKKDGFVYKWETQLGEFMIDEITSQDFPHTIHIQGRDYTKKCLNSKFKVATSFKTGTLIADVIKGIAVEAGIPANKIVFASESWWLGKPWLFDRGVTRWKAMTDIANNYGFELYFDLYGILVMKNFEDPVDTPASFTFNTGKTGNLVHYKKSCRDTRIYNSISVSGEGANRTPVYGIAENHVVGSPTSIEAIGERVYEYTSSFITETAQATKVAYKLLTQHALEEYDLDLEAIGIFWVDAGNIIEFEDPSPNNDDPTKFLLSSFGIPFSLGSMSYSAKRVSRVVDFSLQLTNTSGGLGTWSRVFT